MPGFLPRDSGARVALEGFYGPLHTLSGGGTSPPRIHADRRRPNVGATPRSGSASGASTIVAVNDGPEDDRYLMAYAVPQAASARVTSALLETFPGAFFACALVGGLTSALTGIPYYLEVGDSVAMDWPREGALFFLFGCGIGAAVGAGSMVGMLLMRRLFGTAFRGPVRVMATVLGATLGVALLGTLPGSIGTAYFGAKPMPFVGLAAISVVPFAGALAAATFAGRAEIRDGNEEVSLSFAVASSVLALVPIAGAGVMLALVVPDAVALAWMRSVAADFSTGPDYLGGLGALGAGMGAALGAALGLHVGLTTAIARLRANARPQEESPVLGV